MDRYHTDSIHRPKESASSTEFESASNGQPRPINRSPDQFLIDGAASELALSRSLIALLPETFKGRQIREYQHTSNPRDPLSFYGRWDLPPYKEAVKAIETLLLNVCVTFFIFEPDHIRGLLAKVYSYSDTAPSGYGNQAGEAGYNDLSAVEFYEVLASIAVGAQYDDTIPVGIQERCFQSARFALDECIEEDELKSLTVLTLMVIYQILEKRRSCWRYLSMALQIARSNGLHLKPGTHPMLSSGLGFSGNEWSRYKKLWWTLVFLESWLGATLGRMPSTVQSENMDEIIKDISQSSTEPDPTYTVSLQREVVKIGILSGQILRDVHLSPTPTLYAVSHYMATLESWFEGLPYPLRLNALVNGEVVRKEQRASMLLGHCLYFTSVILLTRRIFLEVMHWYVTGTLNNARRSWIVGEDGSINEALKYFRACLAAANQTGRVMGLMQSQGTLVKKCWVAIHSSFHSSLILLFSVFQQQRNFPGALYDKYSEDYINSKRCLSALEYAAEADQLSVYYLGILEPIRKFLNLEGPFTSKELDISPDAVEDVDRFRGIQIRNDQQARKCQKSDSSDSGALDLPSQSETTETDGSYMQLGQHNTDITFGDYQFTNMNSTPDTITTSHSRDGDSSGPRPSAADLRAADEIYNSIVASGRDPFINDETDTEDNNNRSYNHSATNSPFSPNTSDPDLHIPMPPNSFNIIRGGAAGGLGRARASSARSSSSAAPPSNRKKLSAISTSIATERPDRDMGNKGSGSGSNSDSSGKSYYTTPADSRSTSVSSSAFGIDTYAVTPITTNTPPLLPSPTPTNLKRGANCLSSAGTTNQQLLQQQQQQQQHYHHQQQQQQRIAMQRAQLALPPPSLSSIPQDGNTTSAITAPSTLDPIHRKPSISISFAGPPHSASSTITHSGPNADGIPPVSLRQQPYLHPHNASTNPSSIPYHHNHTLPQPRALGLDPPSPPQHHQRASGSSSKRKKVWAPTVEEVKDMEALLKRVV